MERKDDAEPARTQESGKSKVQYAWVILFHHSLNVSSPFSIVPLKFFLGSDFPWKSVEGMLSPRSRTEKYSFENLPGKHYSIFAKVEFGIKTISLQLYKLLFKNSITLLCRYQLFKTQGRSREVELRISGPGEAESQSGRHSSISNRN